MESADLTFIGSDPGAVRYGNFINYYSFHSAKQRIDNLRPEMFPIEPEDTIFCLDIGCNTGELSNELQAYLQNIYPDSSIHILAIDIDPTLIRRAQEFIKNPTTRFQTADIMMESGQEIVKGYLKSHKKDRFHITFCFSVTMWIHINNGDEGLQEFLKFIKEYSEIIVVESQPWNCYRNAQRRVKKSGCNFPLYETLKIRSNVDTFIEKMLSKETHKKVYESSTSSWKRKIQSYQHI